MGAGRAGTVVEVAGDGRGVGVPACFVVGVAMFASMDVGMAMNGAVGVPMNMFVGGRRLRGGGVTVGMVGAVVMGVAMNRAVGVDVGVIVGFQAFAFEARFAGAAAAYCTHLLFSYPITRFRFP